MFKFFEKKAKDTPDELLAKVQKYADEVEIVDDISAFRNAAVDAVAAYNSMKLEAQEEPDEVLFTTLMPFSEYYAKSIAAAAYKCANLRAANMKVWFHITGFTGNAHQSFDRSTYYFDADRRESSIHVTKNLFVEDISYAFQEELDEWKYFYMLANWLPEQLKKIGLDVVPEERYSYVKGSSATWDDEMESITFIVSWADDDFAEHLSKLYDVSQADAYKAGVPLEDIVA